MFINRYDHESVFEIALMIVKFCSASSHKYGRCLRRVYIICKFVHIAHSSKHHLSYSSYALSIVAARYS